MKLLNLLQVITERGHVSTWNPSCVAWPNETFAEFLQISQRFWFFVEREPHVGVQVLKSSIFHSQVDCRMLPS